MHKENSISLTAVVNLRKEWIIISELVYFRFMFLSCRKVTSIMCYSFYTNVLVSWPKYSFGNDLRLITYCKVFSKLFAITGRRNAGSYDGAVSSLGY